jgi:hypothetical protein
MVTARRLARSAERPSSPTRARDAEQSIASWKAFPESASTRTRWIAFRKGLPPGECPQALTEVKPRIEELLVPIARAGAADETYERRGPAGGPWIRDA